jgi:hypothetical protein
MGEQGRPSDQQQGSGGRNQEDRRQESQPASLAPALLNHFQNISCGPGTGLGWMGAQQQRSRARYIFEHRGTSLAATDVGDEFSGTLVLGMGLPARKFEA